VSTVDPTIEPIADRGVVAEPIVAAPIGSGGLPDVKKVDAAMGGGESLGRSVSASLSSRGGRLIVVVLVFLWTIPTFGLLVSSVRPENEVKTSGWWEAFIRPKFTLSNYDAVLSSTPGSANLGHFFLNSMKITIPAVILSVGIGAMAGYAFAWMKWKGREWVFVGVVALLVVPLQMALIPLLRLITGGAHIGSVTIFPYLHLNNTVAAVWIAHTCFGLPFCIFILKNFISALPKEIIEAARVDGAGHLTVFTRLVLPLSVPALASLAIFQFMWIWNDLLIGIVFAGPENRPVVAKLVEVSGTYGQSWHLLTAAAFVSMFVPLVVFFALQRYFVRGLLAGAVKG
jgi:alpha-glucoside transport system permease protein